MEDIGGFLDLSTAALVLIKPMILHVCELCLCSKLLGGGVESMAITEAFGGEQTPPCNAFLSDVFSSKFMNTFQIHEFTLSMSSSRVSHRKNPAVSHALW